jgi:hypothetical protein
MYSPRHGLSNSKDGNNVDITTWKYRSHLIQDDLEKCTPDIVCFQEVYPETFDYDFQFMIELGYDCSEIFRKGEFRPAIFWKSSKVSPTSEPIHRDRCLIIPFELVSSSPTPSSSGFQLPLYVCNCHLQAGVNNSDRRFRQVSDALETIRKHATKAIASHIDFLKKKSQQMKKRKPRAAPAVSGETTDAEHAGQPQQPQEEKQQPEINYVDLAETLLSSTPIVLLGDMNCDPVDICGSHSLLIYGEATLDGKLTNEKKEAEEEKFDSQDKKDNSVKRHPFLPFVDTYDYAYRSQGGDGAEGGECPSEPPPTMIVEELYDVLTQPLTSDQLSEDSLSGTRFLSTPPEDPLLLTPLAQYNLQLSPLAIARLRLMFEKYAQTSLPPLSGLSVSDSSSDTQRRVMSSGDTKRWLIDINKEWNRGSEFRAAMIRMKFFSSQLDSTAMPPPPPSEEKNSSVSVASVAMPANGYLDWSEYRSIYEQMIAEGKVWAVSADMATCGFPLPDSSRVFTARYDRIYISGGLKDCLMYVRDIPCGSIEEGCRGVGGCLPNALYPSDHLPVAITLSLPIHN